ncbi:MAG TPA: hypothetical protein VMN57_07355 [Anaerolineales bacterium]|nr:hypothetical protein [Anaerolineales bacterium]
MNSSIHRARDRLRRFANDRRLRELAGQVRAVPLDPTLKPVIFFNASTRLGGISQNAGFATLSAMALRLRGAPVHFFACRKGLHRCTLGVMMRGPGRPPPCRTCIAQAEAIFAAAPTTWFEFKSNPALAAALAGKTVPELKAVDFDGVPLGPLTLPSMRWSLRVHHLQDDRTTRGLFRSFIQSAYVVVRAFDRMLEAVEPETVVVFNGISYPEAAARWAALRRGVRVVTHEVAHQPMTAYFSDGHVTAYPVSIPADFELSPAQDARLDAYLEERFQGKVSMAGLEFWPEMHGLDRELVDKIAAHKQLVPIFTNVVFDTSQVHANVLFDNMFAWLDQALELIRAHPETLFVIRAHPDELRPKSYKQAVEKVDDWVAANRVRELPNVVYIPPLDYVSSYDLVRRARFVMVYNSTIGLEAALLGVPVLNGGKARYTQVDCVHLPESAEAHLETARGFLAAEAVEGPPGFVRAARRFQYYQLWRTPIPFDEFLSPHDTRGYVNLKHFQAEALAESTALRVICEGILGRGDFLMPEK